MERAGEGTARTDDIAGSGRGTEEERAPGGTTEARPESAAADSGTGDGATRASRAEDQTPLLPDEEARGFEGRWEHIQVGFVDEPQRCVQEADSLVAEVMQRLADGFSRERKELEGQWASGGEVSTEDLRVALQRYRSFFNRLLRTG
jgi:hypothetical protein